MQDLLIHLKCVTDWLEHHSGIIECIVFNCDGSVNIQFCTPNLIDDETLHKLVQMNDRNLKNIFADVERQVATQNGRHVWLRYDQ